MAVRTEAFNNHGVRFRSGEGIPLAPSTPISGDIDRGQGLADRETEIRRVTVAGIHLLDLSILRKSRAKWFADPNLSEEARITVVEQYDSAWRDLRAYYDLLTQEDNRIHFDNPPTSPEKLRQKWDKRGYYPLVAENMLGEVVGGSTIADAEIAQHDHWLTKVVVDQALQNRKVGSQMMYSIIEWGFSNPTFDGRERSKLDASIIALLPGWESMYRLLKKLGFETVSWLHDQVTVVGKDGEVRVYPTQRWEIHKWKWDLLKPRIYRQNQEYLDSLRDTSPTPEE